MDVSVAQPNRSPGSSDVEASRLRAVAVLGIAILTLALAFNYFVLRGLGFDFLSMIGAAFLIPRPRCLYTTFGCGIVGLGAWILFF